MDLASQAAVEVNVNSVVSEHKEKGVGQGPSPVYMSMVDPFLVEALQNCRHRLTILRMELDIQKFWQNPDQQQFVFPHFPTSYLRLAAHRVAQHYGLQTMVQDNALDGQGSGIVVMKKHDSKFPALCLSDIPSKETENNKPDQIKVVIRPRASKGSLSGANELGVKNTSVRTMEERKEEYDRARARIFSSSSGSEPEDGLVRVVSERRISNLDENEVSRNFDIDGDKIDCIKDSGSSSRVAIFRDREKDRSDPDYDRSYERYVKSIPTTQNFSLVHGNALPKFQPPFVQYDSVFAQLPQMHAPQCSPNYTNPARIPYNAMGLNPSFGDALYMQWKTQSMMHVQSYDHTRRAFLQAPFCQQPLSFGYSQNHW